jgi:hypothetical protein
MQLLSVASSGGLWHTVVFLRKANRFTLEPSLALFSFSRIVEVFCPMEEIPEMQGLKPGKTLLTTAIEMVWLAEGYAMS